MGRHSTLSPSSAKRWMGCTASVRLIQRLREAGEIPEDTSSPEAEEGTAAHAVAAAMLEGGLEEATSMIGTTVEGFTVSPEMAEHCASYCEYVRALGGQLFVEVELPLFYAKGDTGTGDAVIWIPEEQHLHVVDLKYGKGVKVEAEGNPQLRIYARSAENLLADILGDKVKKFTTHIFQPRYREGENIASETLSREEMVDWCLSVIDAADCIKKGDYCQFAPGEETCRWCPAYPCSACQDEVALLFEEIPADDKKSTEVAVDALEPGKIAALVSLKSRMTKFLAAVDERAKFLASENRLPGFKMVVGRSSRDWVDEAEASKKLCQWLGKAKAYEEKLISPAKAEKLLKDEGPRKTKIFMCLFEKKEGSPVLAPIDDPRPALAVADEFEVLADVVESSAPDIESLLD